MRYFLFLFFLCGISCQRSHLRVRTEYFTTHYLAASKVDSPYLCSPCFCGQQIVMRYQGVRGSALLRLSVRLSDHEIVTEERVVRGPWGYWVWRLSNEDFCCKGPISGYKVELYEDDCLVETFCHLWVEPIFD